MTLDRGGSLNVQVGRDSQVVAGEVADLLLREDLEWLCLQEAGQYVAALRRRLARTHRVYAGRGSRSRRDSVVIVRRDVPSGRKRVHALGGIPWERANGRPGLHPPRHMTSVRIRPGASDSYRVASVHLPPTPHALSLPRRARSHAADVAIVARIARRWSKRGTRWVMTGDWNAHCYAPYVDPLRRVGTIIANSGIDWTMRSRAIGILRTRRIRHGGGDHLALLIDVAVVRTVRPR